MLIKMNKPRPYILAETNFKAVKEQNYTVAILPWGATEAHNYHLPYATDNILAEAEIDKVTTPKGCTIEGLNEMEHSGLSSSLIKGIVASYQKINSIS